MRFPYVVSCLFFLSAWVVLLAIEHKTLEQHAIAFINLGLVWFVVGFAKEKEGDK